MRAVADPFLLVVRLDPELDLAAVDAGHFGRAAQPHAHGRRRIMADVEMRAETLVTLGQQVLDGVERRRLHHVDHHRRRQHVHAAAADARRGVLLADNNLVGAFLADFYAGEIHRSFFSEYVSAVIPAERLQAREPGPMYPCVAVLSTAAWSATQGYMDPGSARCARRPG